MGWEPTDPSGTCVRRNSAGFTYEELTCVYPELWGKLFSEWELRYDPAPLRDWMVANPWVPVLACILYGVFIVTGRAYFRTRQPWSWRRTLAVWNFSLSLFSAIGFVRSLVQLIHNLTHYSLHDNLCNDPEHQYGSGTSGVWIQLFILSKFPYVHYHLDLTINTICCIYSRTTSYGYTLASLGNSWIHSLSSSTRNPVRTRTTMHALSFSLSTHFHARLLTLTHSFSTVIFLHWYHHITVLLYCWHSYVTKSPAGIFFVVMNYGVHAIMYGYYFLMAMKWKPKWMNAMVITVAQISQMIVGVGVTALAFYFIGSQECWIKPENNMAAFIVRDTFYCIFVYLLFGVYTITHSLCFFFWGRFYIFSFPHQMYGSYLFLFLQFFIQRYFGVTTKKTTKKKVA